MTMTHDPELIREARASVALDGDTYSLEPTPDVVHTDETVDEIVDAIVVPTKTSPHRIGEWPSGKPKYDYEYAPPPSRHPKFNIVEATQFLADWDTNAHPPVNEDGTVNCPYCPRVVRSIGGFGPHRQSHRTEAEKVLGLPITPPRVGRMSNKMRDARMTSNEGTRLKEGRKAITYEAILGALADGPLKIGGIADALGVTETLDRKSIGNRLRAMVDRGLVRRCDGGKGTGSQAMYELVPAGGEVERVVSARAEARDVNVPEGLAAVLAYSLGADAAVPVTRILDVHEWLNSSSDFIDSLRT